MKLNYQVTRRNPDGSELNLRFSNNQQGNYNKKKQVANLSPCLFKGRADAMDPQKKEGGRAALSPQLGRHLMVFGTIAL